MNRTRPPTIHHRRDSRGKSTWSSATVRLSLVAPAYHSGGADTAPRQPPASPRGQGYRRSNRFPSATASDRDQFRRGGQRPRPPRSAPSPQPPHSPSTLFTPTTRRGRCHPPPLLPPLRGRRYHAPRWRQQMGTAAQRVWEAGAPAAPPSREGACHASHKPDSRSPPYRPPAANTPPRRRVLSTRPHVASTQRRRAQGGRALLLPSPSAGQPSRPANSSRGRHPSLRPTNVILLAEGRPGRQ